MEEKNNPDTILPQTALPLFPHQPGGGPILQTLFK